MRIAVTGGSGELGTHVLRRLAADSAVEELRCVDVRPPLVCSRKVSFVEADVRDRAALERAFAGCDALVHLAFVVFRKLPRDVFWAINVEGSKNAFEAAAAAGAKTVVYTSSVAQYGVLPGHPVPIVEDTPRRPQPEFAYATTKQEVEQWLDGFEREHRDVAISRLRPSLLVGEGMEHGIGRVWRRRALVAPRRAPLPIVWDEDVADAAVLALHKRARGAFNVVADDQRSPADLARACGMRAFEPPRAVGMALGRLSPLLEKLHLLEAFDEQWPAVGEATFIVSSEKAKRELGWSPRCPTSIDVMRRYVDVVPARLDPRIAVFLHALELAAGRLPLRGEAVTLRGRIWLRLTGEGGGDVGLLCEPGKIELAWRPPRPPTSIVTMPAKRLLDVIAGREPSDSLVDASDVCIEGEPRAATALGDMVEAVRVHLGQARGAKGAAARVLARFMAV